MSSILRILFGDVAPERKGRDLFIVLIPAFLADVLTKCLSLGFLGEREFRFLGGELRLHLSINQSLFGSGQDPHHFGLTRAMVFWAAVVQYLMAAAGFAVGRADWTVLRKGALMGLVLLVGPGLGFLLGSFFGGDPPRLAVHAARALGSLTVLLLALRLTRSRYVGLALALWIAGNLGNTLNVIYYPRGVVDFVYIPGLHSYIGVFNLSDLALELAKGMLLLSPLIMIASHRLARRSEAWKGRLEYANPTNPSPAAIPASKDEGTAG